MFFNLCWIWGKKTSVSSFYKENIFKLCLTKQFLNMFKLWCEQGIIRLCGSIVANPIIYRLVSSPSRFEIGQWTRLSPTPSPAPLYLLPDLSPHAGSMSIYPYVPVVLGLWYLDIQQVWYHGTAGCYQVLPLPGLVCYTPTNPGTWGRGGCRAIPRQHPSRARNNRN